MYGFLKILVLPPTSLLLLLVLGMLCWRRPWLGRGLAGFATLALVLLSLPVVAARLLAPLEPYPALTPADLEQTRAQAILVLAGNRATGALEYGGDSLGDLTLARLRYGAWLARRTGLPLYLSGSNPQDPAPSLARLMGQAAETEFQVPVAGIEEGSADTWENARFSASLLAAAGVRRVLLVTHAWHLPRALLAFRGTGLEPSPAPTGFGQSAGAPVEWGDFLPSARALLKSYYACHEYLGLVWYRIREWRA